MSSNEALAYMAHHEAGHAVVAVSLGYDVELLSLRAKRTESRMSGGRCITDSATGRTFCDSTSCQDQASRLIDAVTVKVAGPVAERIASGSTNRLGASSDYQGAAELMYRLVDDDLQEGLVLLDSAIRRAETILRQDWPAVVGLADALLDHRELNRDQVRQIIAEALGSAGPGL